MKFHLSRMVFVSAFFFLVSWAVVAGGQFQDNFVPGEVIVKLSDPTNPNDASSIRSILNASVKRQFTSIGAELWTLENKTVPDAIGLVQGDPRVEYIEPNYIVTADDLFPNDPRFPELWGLHNTGQTGGTPDADIDAPEAWSIETGDSVLVGIIDTGVDWHHVDLADNIYTNPGEIPGNGIDDDGNGFVDDVHGWDFVNHDNDPYDDAGHGSHVAGTIAAVGNNGIGVVGVSWSAKILPIKFLNSGGSGTTADAILSVEYATLMHVRLTNNSWGGGGFSTALRDAIEAAGDEGILFVAAAGNSGLNTDLYPHYPSSYDLDNIISVANTTDRDLLSGSSNYGAVTVDLGAPGSNILSTFPGNTYGTISGTSMATPHVSGAVSLLWSTAPSLPHLEVKDIIMSSVDSIPALTGRTVSGGRLNVFNMLSGLDSIPPARVNDLAVESTGSNTVTLSWTATGDDSTHGTASAYDLRYSTSQIYWNNFDAATPVPGMPSPQPSGSPETFMVTGLDFTTTYYFALVVVDEQDNRSWISNILVSGTTLGVPALDYSPASFDDSLHTGGSSTHALTIRNVGEGTLDFAFPAAETVGPGALPSWLRVEPPSGRVWGGDSMEVEIVFDATGLFGGDYTEPLVLETNDPGQASVSIPTTLHVTNAPDIAMSPEMMDFGDIYVGVSRTDTLIVTNIGTDVLTVSGMAIDEPQFSVDPAGFTLGLGASHAVPVTFAPVSAGTITGTLMIESNDPDHPTLVCPLEGLGVEPPIITVTPPSLSDDLYTGSLSTQTLTIGNSGGSPLDFEISIEDVDGGASAVDNFAGVSLPGDVIKAGRPLDADQLASLKEKFPQSVSIHASGAIDNGAASVRRSDAPMDIERVEGVNLEEVFGSDENMFGGSMRSRGNLFTCTTSTTLVEHRLYLNPVSATQMWFLVYEGTAQVGTYDLVSASDVSPAGPGLGWYSSGDIRVPMEAGRFYLIVASFEQSASYFNEQEISPYPIPASFGELTAGAGWDWAPPTDFPPAPIVDVPSYAFGGPVAYYQTLVTGSAVRWLSLAPEEGSVPAMSSMDVEVTFDAAGLNGGDYAAAIVVANNDPFNPEVTVPVDLHVTGAPDIEVSETLIDYGEVFIGAEIPHTLTVTNAGTDALAVSDISSSHPDYTVDITSFTLAPGASQDVIVTFAPTTVAPIPGMLTITSNDPDEHVVEIQLHGEGIEPPIIGVAPASLSDSLFTGETSIHALSISNTGGSNLEFDITTEEIEMLLGSAVVKTSISVPRSTGDFPRGAYPPSAGPAPENGQPAGSAPSNAAVPAAMGGSAFATETANYQATRFNLNVPEILNFVGAAPQFIWAGDFGSGDNSFAYAVNDLNQFVRIDTLDGSQTVLGPMIPYGSEGWTGMAMDPTNGRMYATSTNIGSSSLYEIDVETATATRIGPVGLPGIISLAVDTDGNMFAHDIVTDELISIDKMTGVGTPVGSLGFDANYGQGMAFDPVTEQLYLAAFNNYTFRAELRIADRTTGATALVGALGSTSPGGTVQLGWLGVPGLGGVPWLSLDPKSGIVPPGASVNVEVNIDAAGLNGGDYQAGIVIANNDPLNPEVAVPVDLHVTGAPDIAVSDTLFDYGPVFIGAVVKDTLVVSNVGTDVLSVGEISVSHGDYTTDTTPFTLNPGENQLLEISFAPSSVGPIDGVLTLTSDDPDEEVVTVALHGEGVGPPVIAVAPDSLADSLFSGGTSTQLLTISNSGVSPLEFQISRENLSSMAVASMDASLLARPGAGEQANPGTKVHVDARGPSGSDSRAPHEQTPILPIETRTNAQEPEILVVQDYSAWGVDMYSFILSEFGIASTVINSNQIPTTDFSQFDLVVTTGDQSSNYYQMLSSNVAKFESFVASGGVVQYQLATQGSNVDIVNGVDILFGNGEYTNTVVTPEHPIVAGLSTVLDGNLANHTYLANLPAEAVVITQATLSQAPTTVEYKYGGGTVIATGMTWEFLYYYGYEAGAMLRNAMAYSMSLAGVSWLSVSPSAGTVPPGTSLDVEVTFDAAGLNGGDYAAEIVIANNDPLNPEVAVPVDLHVTGAPDIAVSDTLFDYGPVFIGAVVKDTLVVSNVGTDVLSVSEISVSHGDYTVDTTPFTLDIGENRLLEISFAPSSVGPIDGVLTLTSDDPDEEVVTVALHGEGVGPPVIAVAPDSLAESLFTGETSTHTMTISNTGASDLTFDLSVVEPEATQSNPDTTTSSDIPYLDLDKGETDPRVGPPVAQSSGGPDGFGYRWVDSDDPGGPVFSWLDITGVGTPMFLGDDGSQLVSLPFAFPFYGVDRTSVVISANGYLTFGTDGSSFVNQPIPYPASPNDMIAAFWDDLYPGGGGPVYYYYDAPDNRFIVQYQNVPHLSGGGPYTFEVILNENGSILIQYLTMYPPLNGSTTGIENPTGTDGLQVAFNTNYVHDNLALRFSTMPPWLGVDPGSGTVPPGMSMDIDVTFDAAGLDGGDYAAEIAVANNDPLNPEVVVPVDLHVTAIPDIAVSDSLLDFGPVFVGATNQLQVTVSNIGNDELIIDAITSSNPDVSASPSSFAVPQGGNQTVTVTFAPTTPGVVSDTLTVTSNDPDEPELLIAVAGEGLIPPEAILTPDSLYEALLSGGASDQTLTISNPGGSTLEYSISIGVMADSSAVAGSSALQPPADTNRPGSGRGANAGLAIAPVADGNPGTVDPVATQNPKPGAAQNAALNAGTEMQTSETSVTWLSVSPVSGTVPAGGNDNVTVSFDAAGLLGGDYEAFLIVSTNVPAAPQITVPVVLDVTGIPAIAVSDTLLDFGTVYLGYQKTKNFTVRNTGTDDLEVSDITVDDPSFSVAPTAFTLNPAHSVLVSVTNTPTETGTIDAVLSIASNDPENGITDVDLTVDVLIPPVVSASPDSFVVSLAPGEIYSDTLRLSNTGGSDLVWSAVTTNPMVAVSLQPPSAAAGRDGSDAQPAPTSSRDGRARTFGPESQLNILWHGDHGLGNIGLWSTIISDLTARGATVTQSTDPITDALLADVDIIWFGDRDISFTASEITALGAWITAGGSMLIEANSDGSYTVYNYLLEDLGSGIYYFFAPGFGGNTPNIYPHETTVGVDLIYLLGPAKVLGAMAPSAGPLVDDLLNHTVVAYDHIGDGRVVVMSDHIFHDVAINNADNRLFANQVFGWFGAINWLTVTPSDGTLGPAETTGLALTIDATTLLPGSYQQNVDILSNDPATPVVTVPVHLRVDSTSTATGIETDRLPTRYALHPNYPNPFNPTTTIAYDLPERADVKLVIYDVGGREVRRLVNDIQPRGRYEVTWDGRNASGTPAASGVYFYKLAAGDFVNTRKMVLLK